jgi:SAM-dependent methyltransferase
MQTRKILSRLLPGPARLYRQYLKSQIERSRRKFGAYTVAEAFSEIYRTGRWGAAQDGPFFSGDGSRDEFAEQYVNVVGAFARERGVRRILDIGCGDFRVGRKLVAASGAAYVGFDIVPALIEHNTQAFGGPGVEFICGNAIDDELPDADLCLIRQVLQHLSNAQVSKIMAKCQRYPFVIVTEDLYVGADAVPNVDKPHGPDTRWTEQSGIYLDLAPFNYPTETLLETTLTERTVLRSVLLAGSQRTGDLV